MKWWLLPKVGFGQLRCVETHGYLTMAQEIYFKMAKCAKVCSNKNNMMNGNVSPHTGRTWVASGACARCSRYGEVQRSPEPWPGVAQEQGAHSLPAAGDPLGLPPPPPDSPVLLPESSCTSAWLFRILQGCSKLLLSINHPVIQGDCGPPFDALAFSHIHLHLWYVRSSPHSIISRFSFVFL